MKTAVVTQVGKFYKVITNTGEDISNQIDRPVRKQAIELNAPLEFDESKNCWRISGTTITSGSAVVKPTTLVRTALDKLEESLAGTTVAKRTRKVYTLVEQPKPEYQIDEIVDVLFIGQKYRVQLTALEKNPSNTNRWIYTGKCVSTGLVIPFIGIGDTEQFANIIVESK